MMNCSWLRSNNIIVVSISASGIKRKVSIQYEATPPCNCIPRAGATLTKKFGDLSLDQEFYLPPTKHTSSYLTRPGEGTSVS
jgi:hypothetical protein